MAQKGEYWVEYAIYDKNDNLLFMGNIAECMKFTGLTRSALNTRMWRTERGFKTRKYQVVRLVDEDDE